VEVKLTSSGGTSASTTADQYTYETNRPGRVRDGGVARRPARPEVPSSGDGVQERLGRLDRLRADVVVYAIRYTSCMARIVPVREFRTNLSELLSDVADRRDHVLVTRNGKPAAALVPIDEYDALEETAEILSDSETLAAIEAGVAELSRGETVTLAALRAELDERRPAR